MPKEFCCLQCLTSLSLVGDNLVGDLPTCIASMPSLTSFSVSYNSMLNIPYEISVKFP
jgi:Leucine-rich repeat (LRR) protein